LLERAPYHLAWLAFMLPRRAGLDSPRKDAGAIFKLELKERNMTVKVQRRETVSFIMVLDDETGDVHFFFPVDEPENDIFIVKKNGELEKGPQFQELIDYLEMDRWGYYSAPNEK
jgi:hypothetical protein